MVVVKKIKEWLKDKMAVEEIQKDPVYKEHLQIDHSKLTTGQIEVISATQKLPYGGIRRKIVMLKKYLNKVYSL